MTDRRTLEIAALLDERRGYVARGLSGRIAAVDAALATLGYTASETAALDNAPETAAVPRGRKRRR